MLVFFIFCLLKALENTMKHYKKMWSLCNLQGVLVEQERAIKDGSIFLLYPGRVQPPKGDILLTRTTNRLKISIKIFFCFFGPISDFFCVFWKVWHLSNAN